MKLFPSNLLHLPLVKGDSDYPGNMALGELQDYSHLKENSRGLYTNQSQWKKKKRGLGKLHLKLLSLYIRTYK